MRIRLTFKNCLFISTFVFCSKPVYSVYRYVDIENVFGMGEHVVYPMNGIEDVPENKHTRVCYPSFKDPLNANKDYVYLPRESHDMLYSLETKLPVYTIHRLKRSDLAHGVDRAGFVNDSDLVRSGFRAYITRQKDFAGCAAEGFQRGHHVPAADRKSRREVQRQTSYFSNIFLQNSNLNLGIWKRIENKARDYALTYNKIYVITGGSLNYFLSNNRGPHLHVIRLQNTYGNCRIPAPAFCYKILIRRASEEEAIEAGYDEGGEVFITKSYRLKNEPTNPNADPEDFVTSLGTIEYYTNLQLIKRNPSDIFIEASSDLVLGGFKF